MIPVENIGEEQTSSEDIESDPEIQEDPGGFNIPCLGSLAMPVGLIGVALLQRTKVKKKG